MHGELGLCSFGMYKYAVKMFIKPFLSPISLNTWLYFALGAWSKTFKNKNKRNAFLRFILKEHDFKMIYPVFHGLKCNFWYFTCIRNWQKHGRGRSHCFPMELEDKIFCGGFMAPKAKYNQVFRLIGDKKWFMNIPNMQLVYLKMKHNQN